MIPDNLCIIPFISISAHPGGFISRCMMSSTPMANISDPNFWDNENFTNLRSDMLSNNWNLPGCITCHQRENHGLVSQRINWKTNERWWNSDIWDNGKFTVANNNIYHLFLNTSNLCNFKCRMCNSLYSNSWINDEQLLINNGFNRKIHKEFEKNQNDLKDFIIKLLPKLSKLRLITITGGEPFIDDSLIETLEILDQAGILKNLHLSITTNGSLLKESSLLRIKNAKKININLSIDGTEKLFEYMRSNHQCSWDKLNNIIQMILNFKKDYRNFVLSLNASYQIYNMLNVKDFYDWAESLINRPDEWIEYRLLTNPEYLHVSIAPDKIKKMAVHQLDYVESTYNKSNKFFLNNMRKSLLLNFDQKLWIDFQKFTLVLDRKRNQDIKQVCPDLYEYFTI